MHIKFDHILDFKFIYTHGSPAQNFIIYAAFHRDSNAVYRLCKSYTLKEIPTII